MNIRVVAACAALAALLTGCSSVVQGTGRHILTAPTPRTPAPARPTGCPHVEYPGAKLSFDCLTGGMRSFYDGQVWPVSERKVVERATDWLLEEGAGHWGSPEGQSLATIAVGVRQQMVSVGGYGAGPQVHTDASRPTTVDGHAAYLLQTTFTLDRGWAQANGTRVRQEKLWILAIEIGAGDVSLWYASVPDLAKSLWQRVPATIAAIQVG